MTTEELIRSFINIRTHIETEAAKHKAEIAELEVQKDLISAQLLEICNEKGLDSFKTDAGSVSRSIRSRYWGSDWEEFYKVIDEHKAYELMEKRIHAGNMKTFLEEHPEINLNDVGVQVDHKYSIRVTKPRAS